MPRPHLAPLILLSLASLPALAGARALPVTPDTFCHRSPLAPTGVGELLGRTVAVHGDRIAVGAPSSPTPGAVPGPAVYVYRREGGLWVFEDRVTPTLPLTHEDHWGQALAMTDTVLAVGADDEDGAAIDGGAVHLYERSGDQWLFQERLEPAALPNFSRFGFSLAMEGDRQAVGASQLGGGLGGVYLYERGPGGWAESFRYELPMTTQLGSAVALRSPYLFVGESHSDAAADGGGAVHVFHSGGAHGFVETLVAPDAEPFDAFGAELDVSGDVLVVGAAKRDDSFADEGAAYVFLDTHGPDGFEFDQKLTSEAPEEDGRFGMSVAADGDRVLVGAGREDSHGHENAGVGHAYRRATPAAPFELEARLSAVDETPYAGLGTAVELSGDLALLGAHGADHAGSNSGALYLFSLAAPHAAGLCPSDVLAVDVRYGLGKPGAAGVPRLLGGAAPVVGTETSIEIRNAPPGAQPLLLVGLAPAAVPFDDGELFVDAPHLMLLPPVSPAGELTFAWPIDPVPALAGVTLYEQVLFLDPTAGGPLMTSQSNGLMRVVGY